MSISFGNGQSYDFGSGGCGLVVLRTGRGLQCLLPDARKRHLRFQGGLQQGTAFAGDEKRNSSTADWKHRYQNGRLGDDLLYDECRILSWRFSTKGADNLRKSCPVMNTTESPCLSAGGRKRILCPGHSLIRCSLWQDSDLRHPTGSSMTTIPCRPALRLNSPG